MASVPLASVPVVSVDAKQPDEAIINRAAALLKRGGLVAFPTETVYGLGAAIFDVAAVRRIFKAKGRPATDPLIVHVLEAGELSSVAGQPAAVAMQLAAAFWPGPLTLIVPRGAAVPREVTAGLETVAVRAPSHPVARALIAALGQPIAAPSANPFGRISPTRAEHVAAGLGEQVDLILDAGPCPLGLESTVVDTTCQPPRILRPGAVPLEQLRAVVPGIAAPVRLDDPLAPSRSPGTAQRHYAPRARLAVLTGETAAVRAAIARATRDLVDAGQRVGLLLCDDDMAAVRAALADLPFASPSLDPSRPTKDPATIVAVSLGPRSEPSIAALRLYAALFAIDDAGADVALARDPGSAGLAMAVGDRLLRAAEGRVVAVESEESEESAEMILRALLSI